MKEQNEFLRIDSAHLDGYPYITFIDTDKDIGISIHANNDHFDVISNFDDKKSFDDFEMALNFAKGKGEEMYAVYDFDTRAKFALDDFLSHAKSFVGGVVTEKITILEPDSVVDTRDPMEIEREWFQLYKNTARVNEMEATMVNDPEGIYIIKIKLPSGEVLDVRCEHPYGDAYHTLPPVKFNTIHNDVSISNKTFMGLIDGIKEAMGTKYHSTI
jgi:hypothetical protein